MYSYSKDHRGVEQSGSLSVSYPEGREVQIPLPHPRFSLTVRVYGICSPITTDIGQGQTTRVTANAGNQRVNALT